MTLRRRMLYVIGLTVVTLLLLLYALSWLIIQRSFAAIEQKDLQQHVKRVVDALSNELDGLDAIVHDWAVWDDTYQFMNDRNETYIQSNLVDNTLIGLDLNVMLFIDATGAIVYQKSVLPDELQAVGMSPLHAYLTRHPEALRASELQRSLKGVLILPEHPMLITIHPILTSQEEGPSRGMLLFGRSIDAQRIERLKALTHLAITIFPVDALELPQEFRTIQTVLTQDHTIVTRPINAHLIAGYTVVNDLLGHPGLLLKIELPREVYQQGRTTLVYFILAYLASGILLGSLFLWLLEKTVLSRVVQLNREIGEIRTQQNLTLRVPAVGSDEISHLAQAINTLLASLQQSQHELIRSEERYRTIIENAPVGILSIDADGRLLHSNPMLVAMLGSPSEEAVQALNIFKTPTLIASGMTADFKQCLSTGEPQIAERSYRSPWGKHLYVRAYLNPIRTTGQQNVGVQAIIEDITERVLVEHALKKSETEYRSLFKNMHNGIAYQKIVFDADQHPIDAIFLDVNDAFEQLTGLRQVIGKRMTEVFPLSEAIAATLIKTYENVAVTGHRTTFEAYFEPLDEWFSIAAYSSEHGYVVTMFHDITERKWAEESLRKLNEELEQRVAARTLELQKSNEFLLESLNALEKAQKQLIESEKMAALGGLVAGVAHEISTPLGIGITAASYLADQTQQIDRRYRTETIARSDLEQYLKTVGESAAMISVNLQRAAEHLKSFKQVAVDQTHDTKHVFNLKRCIDNVLFSLRPKLKTTRHTVTVRCPETLELESYPGAFSQILTNFVINSLVHGFEHQLQGEITIEAEEQAGTLRLSYRDNGKGFSEQAQAHLFEPFYTTKREAGGTGLGLHLVYNLVTHTLGGQITCESAAHAGSVFTITIPITPEGDRTL